MKFESCRSKSCGCGVFLVGMIAIALSRFRIPLCHVLDGNLSSQIHFYKSLFLHLADFQRDYDLEYLHQVYQQGLSPPNISQSGPTFDPVPEIDTSDANWEEKLRKLWDVSPHLQTPIVLRKFVTHSGVPKLKNFAKWTIDNLSKKVFIKNHSTIAAFTDMAEDKSAVKMEFSEFVKRLRSKEKVYMRCVPDEEGWIDDEIPYDFIAKLSRKSFSAWLSRSVLFGSRPLGCLFVGNDRVSTRMHTDVTSTHFFAVQGRKEWIFLPPSATNLLFPTGQKWNLAYNGHVDIFNVNHTQYPMYRFLHGKTTILEPGDFLMFPSMWWHGVRNLDEETIGLDVAVVDFVGSWARNGPLTLGTLLHPKMVAHAITTSLFGGTRTRDAFYNGYFAKEEDYY